MSRVRRTLWPLLVVALLVGAAVGVRTGTAQGPARTSAALSPAGTVLPEQYGAVGDGRTDDTRALQAALDALGPGRTLLLPPGRTYRHDGVLVVRRAGSRLAGGGALLAGEEEHSALRLEADDVRVEGVVLRLARTSRRWSGLDQHRLLLGPHDGIVVRDVRVEGSAASGVFVRGARGFRLERLTVQDTRADGIHLTAGASYGVVDRPVVRRSGDDGVAIVSYASDAATSHHLTVLSPLVQGQRQGRGISVVGGEDVVVRDVRVEGSSAAAVLVATEGSPYDTRSTRRVAVDRVVVESANRSADVDHGAVLVTAGARGTVVEDVRISDVRIAGTRPGASAQVGVLVGDGATARDVLLERFSLRGGGPVFRTTGAAGVRRTGWTVDGQPVADDKRAG